MCWSRAFISLQVFGAVKHLDFSQDAFGMCLQLNMQKLKNCTALLQFLVSKTTPK